jgi:hypothetical protein
MSSLHLLVFFRNVSKFEEAYNNRASLLLDLAEKIT